jgi:protein-S-isoprenylcysteine O-methyltransferase Ste14
MNATSDFKSLRGFDFKTSAARMQTELERPSLKKSRAYQYRIPVTAVVLVGTWIYVVLTRPWIPPTDPVFLYTEIAAWIFFFGGVLLRIWATLWIAGRKKQTLVDDGPYRMCRNPLYLGTFAMGIGLGLFLKDPVFAVGLALILALYVLSVVPAEEDYMWKRFQASYDEYRARVPRWFPKISLLRRDEIFRSTGDRGAIYRECLRMICWIALPILAVITSRVRGTAWWTSS